MPKASSPSPKMRPAVPSESYTSITIWWSLQVASTRTGNLKLCWPHSGLQSLFTTLVLPIVFKQCGGPYLTVA